MKIKIENPLHIGQVLELIAGMLVDFNHRYKDKKHWVIFPNLKEGQEEMIKALMPQIITAVCTYEDCSN